MRSSHSSSLSGLGLARLIQIIFHLPRFVKLFFRLVRDARVPLAPKMLLLLVLSYVIIPTDLLPDFLLGLGQVDDLLVIFIGLRLFLRLCPKEIVQEHVQAIAARR
ncbi:MAG TPA: DUF1232 domain-containing protein [Terriglobales bacterium]|nr:DUF1232 domain-containing protein [Terriglobales bacterium]